jgi:hypothetical protein
MPDVAVDHIESVWTGLQRFPQNFEVAEARGALDLLTLGAARAATTNDDADVETVRAEPPNAPAPTSSVAISRREEPVAKRARFRLRASDATHRLPQSSSSREVSHAGSVEPASTRAACQAAEVTRPDPAELAVAPSLQSPKPKRARFALVGASPTRRATPSAVQAPSFLKRRRAQDARLDAQSEPDDASAPPATYFEKQVQSRCGMHALNNLFGARACTEEAPDEALQT